MTHDGNGVKNGVRASPRESRLGYLAPAVAAWALGMLLQFYPMLLSGMQKMEGNQSDSRLVNYILEHSYRWVLSMPGHESFWSPHVFFPAPDTAAYSDVLLGVAPLYWLWRLGGFAPDTAFQLWILSLATLNFALAFVLLVRGFRCRPVASAVGALLLTFAAMRTSQVMHAQLIPLFYIELALLAILRIFAPEPRLRAGVQMVERRTVWIFVLAAACVAQLYSSFYYGWFLCFALLLAALWSLLLPGARLRLFLTLRANARALAVAVVLAALLLAPLATHYLGAKHQVGPRTFDLVDGMLPRVQSWAYSGAGSWVYGWLTPYVPFRGLPLEHEQQLGIGIATALLAGWGLWLSRRRRSVQFCILVPLTMALLATRWPGGFTLWRAVFFLVPGAGALRAVSRIGVAILFPAAIGIAYLVDAISGPRRIPPSQAAIRIRAQDRRRRAIIILAIVAVIAAEQLGTPRSFDKASSREHVARIASMLDSTCDAFLYTSIGGVEDPWFYQLDAMWASMNSGVPTINGYSGNEPPGWFFYDIRVHTPEQDSVIRESLARWEERWKLNPSRVCRVRTPG